MSVITKEMKGQSKGVRNFEYTEMGEDYHIVNKLKNPTSIRHVRSVVDIEV